MRRKEKVAETGCIHTDNGCAPNTDTPCMSCRNKALEAEVARLTAALKNIIRSGDPGAAIVSKRDDGHACFWCRGISTPCPVETARKALEEVTT